MPFDFFDFFDLGNAIEDGSGAVGADDIAEPSGAKSVLRILNGYGKCRASVKQNDRA